MRLYFFPGACSMSPHIALREAGLDFKLERVDPKTKTVVAGGGDFNAINPKSMVPVLELDNGELLTEGPAIVQYIADRKPEAKLAPAAGTLERSRLQEWLNYITAEIHKGFTPLFKPDTPDAYKAIARANLETRFGFIDKKLAGKQYLLGDTFSVADGYLFTVMNWARLHNIDLATWPNLAAFMERVRNRPKVQETMKAEGLIK
jgi:glutathione S-transferase